MLVGADDGGIDEQVFHVSIATQHVGHPLPNAEKKIVHKNKASRTKSRLSAQIKALAAA